MTSSLPEPSKEKEFIEVTEEKTSSPVTEPSKTSATTNDIPDFGWSIYAERVNGRFAMIGFIALLLVEIFSNDLFLHWAGLVP